VRILYINQYFPPEIEPSATKVHEVGRELVRMGHQVTVITGFPHYPTGIVQPQYRGKLVQTEELDGIRVLRTWLWPASTSHFLRRIACHISFAASAFLRAVGSGACDVIVCSSPPLEIALAGVAISTIKRRPFVFEVRDLWPDEPIQTGQLKGKFLIALARWIEHTVYCRAACLVAVSPGFVAYLQSQGVPHEKITVLPNGTDVNLFGANPQARTAVRVELGLEDAFVVGYTGTHGFQHHLETVLVAARMLLDQPGICFLFVGDGKEKSKLVDLGREWRLSNVQFLPTHPRARVARILTATDICVTHSEDIPINRRNLQSKLFDYMAAGKPIVLGCDGEMRNLIENAGAGIWVGAQQPERMAQAILRLKNEPVLRTQLGQAGREYALRHLSRERVALEYLVVFRHITTEGSETQDHRMNKSGKESCPRQRQ